MGISDIKYCAICGNFLTFPKQKTAIEGEYLCQQCALRAVHCGIYKSTMKNSTADDIVQMIQENEEKIRKMHERRAQLMSQMQPQETVKQKDTLCCPSCGGHNIEIIRNNANTKQSTSWNINPLKPLTILNHKEKQKRNILGMKNKNNLDVFCRDCGNRWQTR